MSEMFNQSQESWVSVVWGISPVKECSAFTSWTYLWHPDPAPTSPGLGGSQQLLATPADTPGCSPSQELPPGWADCKWLRAPARDSQHCASLPSSSHCQHPILHQVMSISNSPHRKQEKQDTLCTPLVLCILQMQFPSSKISHSFWFTLNKITMDFWWIAELKIHLEAFLEFWLGSK